MGGGREGKKCSNYSFCVSFSRFVLVFFLAHVCPNVVWQSIAPCSIREVSAAVSILLSVIRENAEKERLPRESQLCCLFSFSFCFPWKLWLIHSSRFSPAFHSPDSVTISHSTTVRLPLPMLVSSALRRCAPFSATVAICRHETGSGKKKTLLGLSVSQQTAGAGMAAS